MTAPPPAPARPTRLSVVGDMTAADAAYLLRQATDRPRGDLRPDTMLQTRSGGAVELFPFLLDYARGLVKRRRSYAAAAAPAAVRVPVPGEAEERDGADDGVEAGVYDGGGGDGGGVGGREGGGASSEHGSGAGSGSAMAAGARPASAGVTATSGLDGIVASWRG